MRLRGSLAVVTRTSRALSSYHFPYHMNRSRLKQNRALGNRNDQPTNHNTTCARIDDRLTVISENWGWCHSALTG
jgi:hypothetical protein